MCLGDLHSDIVLVSPLLEELGGEIFSPKVILALPGVLSGAVAALETEQSPHLWERGAPSSPGEGGLSRVPVLI